MSRFSLAGKLIVTQRGAGPQVWLRHYVVYGARLNGETNLHHSRWDGRIKGTQDIGRVDNIWNDSRKVT